ncbi:MAG: hypothetical protein ABW187_01820 [Dokdonella sp.]
MRVAVLFVASAALVLAACSKSEAPVPQAAPALALELQGQKELELYRKLQLEKSYELAAPIGKEIVAKYPQSAAAKEVQITLADASAKADAITTQRRLERLWSYQSGKESGGEQNTASIYSKDTVVADRVRLVLRRHSAWGQSTYLFGNGKGFECGSGCSLAIRFDDQPPKRMKAYLPETGEPAVFISDDKAFIERLDAAEVVSIDVTEKGRGARTLVFEVGGFDAAKFPPVKKK